MPTFPPDELKRMCREIFEAVGTTLEEARIVSDALVESNLAGHDSHGVLRIPEYVRSIEEEHLNVGAHIKVIRDFDSYAVIDGGWGFGQVVGKEAMEVAIRKASKTGVGTVAGSQCCHLGRVGDYPKMAAMQGMAAVMFVNTHGGGKHVAPWGGRERRLSANPISIAIPRKDGAPIVVDISTSAIAAGKVHHMHNRKVPVPLGNIIDSEGNPTTDAVKFYGPPAGALMPFGGHKGFALGFVTDILAGAISGGGCSRKDANRRGNAFLVFVVNIAHLRGQEPFYADVEQLIDFVKSSALAPGFREILVPGEPELWEQARRQKDGIAVDDETWHQISEVAKKYGVACR